MTCDREVLSAASPSESLSGLSHTFTILLPLSLMFFFTIINSIFKFLPYLNPCGEKVRSVVIETFAKVLSHD